VPPRTRSVPSPPGDERTTVVCGCGVVMTVSWRTVEPVRCFGCQRIFEPPPTVTATPLRWRPELAGGPRPPRRPIFLPAAIALVLFALLGAALAVLLHRP